MNRSQAANKRPVLSFAGKLNFSGLIAAAIGILILFITGWVSQSIPVGTVLLLLSAGFVGFGRWRWILFAVEFLTLFIFVAGFIAPGLFVRLGNPSVFGAFIGTWIQEIGLVIALIAGAAAIKQSFQDEQRK